MSSRVIAGQAKGRKLKSVPGNDTRPIMDRVKEALFSIIGPDIIDAHMLDLFAGTGAVGIEALSRGAEYVLFNEINRAAVRVIEDNLETTRLQAGAEIRSADAFELLKYPSETPFDYIYVAPPQYKGMWRKALETLDTTPAWIAPETSVIVQIDPKEQAAITLTHLRAYDERRYGNTLLWFFESNEG
jgi:16S rRNA (guanine966-N2)-methyltransferase